MSRMRAAIKQAVHEAASVERPLQPLRRRAFSDGDDSPLPLGSGSIANSSGTTWLASLAEVESPACSALSLTSRACHPSVQSKCRFAAGASGDLAAGAERRSDDSIAGTATSDSAEWPCALESAVLPAPLRHPAPRHWLAQLSRMPCFEATPTAVLEGLLRQCTMETFAIDQRLPHTSAGEAHVLFIVEGQVRLSREIQVERAAAHIEPHTPGMLGRGGNEVVVRRVSLGTLERGSYFPRISVRDEQRLGLLIHTGVTHDKVAALVAARTARIEALASEYAVGSRVKAQRMRRCLEAFADGSDMVATATMRVACLRVGLAQLIGALDAATLDRLCSAEGEGLMAVTLRTLQDMHIRGEAMRGFRDAVQRQLYEHAA
ncbi:hypothetical protein HK105_200926 [Polyrhizophydium stewartii]|uniref:Cyclic nucleotide-binding domain-containing protein n=1 Tax=Polyrhizophydium stewartii TaxID=2732419 RepID=A0ABR4NID4_9FUNG